MATEQILQILILERDKLNRAIEALGGTSAKRRGRPPKGASPDSNNPSVPDQVEPATAVKSARKKRVFSAEQRQAQAEKMKAFWAKRRRAAKKAA